jgi:heat shock protein HslJ
MTARMLLGPALLVVLVLAGCADAAAGPSGAAPGPRPAVAGDLLGRWYPADGTAQGRAFAEFADGGAWTGSDGCNGQSGTWAVGPGGAVTGTAGMSTMIACENVPVARWIAEADRAEIDGTDLVLHGGYGTARLVRDLP